ncbi:ATP/GTP-binding protein [Chryseomicrobium palamuruense]|uniref:ATP/GTP-binding protein n=1 Tax=Chryseomicrobium palamuruense TaxID=682973 RepID=A0ABV8UUU7_9BACL
MKILKMRIDGLFLFDEGIDLDFVAKQRVTEQNDAGLSHIFGNLYRQNVVGIIGINASGKTTVLKALSFVMDIFEKQGKLNDEKYEFLANEEHFQVEVYFKFEGDKLMKIQSLVTRNRQDQMIFEEEKIWVKKIGKVKKLLYTFSDKHLLKVRSREDSPYLADDMSMIIAYMKKQEPREIIDLISETNKNVMKAAGQIPVEMVNFLDKSIDYLTEERDANHHVTIRLKFKGQDQEIYLTNHQHLEAYLSSGTIKGLNVLAAVEKVFRSGGMLIMDEIENHFNKEVVRTIVNFFRNERINPKGAMLVFTTHYSELLDDFERNDSIYISLKEDKLRIRNLNDLFNRSDYKKSEVYQSSYVGPTAPAYDAYMDLKRYLQQVHST